MKTTTEDHKKALELRKKGLSYKEIQKEINVSKSLLSKWFKEAQFSISEKKLLEEFMKENQKKGRVASALSNRTRRINREIIAFEKAKKMFKMYETDHFFHIGVALYWAHGSKLTSGYQFTNADPYMVGIIVKWIQKYLNIPKDLLHYRLYIQHGSELEAAKAFWAGNLGLTPKVIKITTYELSQSTSKKNISYTKGSLRVEAGGIHELRLLKAWQKLLVQYIV